ncbi:MAG: FtsX-like permease family protein, partial [Cellulosilyticaceae bacterium]
MYFKLAFNNVKKSFKDYGIYFLTLTFSVCIFYVFNAIDSQKAMMDLSQTTNMMMQNLIDLIGYLSIFVAVVLGLLMLYANQFLIRRRKKELGLYMLMGMEKMKISWILTLETFMVGLCSLVAGLGLGIFLSQGLSVFTAKLFGAYMSRFEFMFSSQALVKSIICFLVIYSVIICFNIRNLGKYKLIELLEAHKKNEAPKVKNLWVSVILFVLAVMSLGT